MTYTHKDCIVTLGERKSITKSMLQELNTNMGIDNGYNVSVAKDVEYVVFS